MVSVRPRVLVLCAALVLLCLVPHSSCFALSRMARQVGQQQCAAQAVCAFENYDVNPPRWFDRCTCPSGTTCVRDYNNLRTFVWNHRCHYVSR